MGLTDRLRDLTKSAGEHSGTLKQGVDKAAGFADKATNGRYKKVIHSGEQKAHQAIDKMGGKAASVDGEHLHSEHEGHDHAHGEHDHTDHHTEHEQPAH